ncbi:MULTISPECIES: TolB family protein [Flavobacteriaceae]|uniref:TolB family protein n=1 Tax=Flavobacteriaceae TaxID=49546 RepID=UPI00149094B8|nr:MULTISPECIES: PD40 domain-containing protein [Allomuricauda]MDC6366686.1 PD40 domain-containing protein [Muricauda sp. AC10]
MKTLLRYQGLQLLFVFGLFQYNGIGQTNEIAFFQANKEGSKGNIFLMNPDGSSPKQIGQSGIRPDYYPNWSKDGKKITFESYRRGGWRIWITDPDGSNARRLDNVGRDYEFDPVFDADGSHVVYSRRGDLYRVNVKSGKTELLVKTDNKYESQPDVSIHDEVIYVSGDESGSNIIKKNLKNGKETILTSKRHADLAPVWSPDATEILFYSDREGGFELFIMGANGSNVRRLVSNETLKRNGIQRGKFLKLDEGWNHSLQYRASFSTDGKWIAFSANTSHSREIFIISKDGKSLRQITKNKLHDGLPSFRPVVKN